MHLLTYVDRFKRRPEATALPDITADSVARAFGNGWISRFGVPSTFPTDCGEQFESTLLLHVSAILGFNRTKQLRIISLPMLLWQDFTGIF